MERRKDQEEPVVKQPATPTKRGKRRLSLVRKTTYTLDELPALVDRLRHEEATPEEIARRHRVAERVARLRAKLPTIDAPVDEWIRAVREDSMIA